MQEQPEITIGITAFREGKLLTRAWESVLNQTLKNYSVVIVLDGNADQETIGVFESINDPRVVKFRFSQNAGPYAARTKAIELTSTPWFYFLDGDDTLPANAIELITVNIQQDINFFFGNVLLLHPDSRKEELVRPFFTLEKILLEHEAPAVICFRKSFFYQLDGYNPLLWRGKADLDFLLKIYDSKCVGKYLPYILYNYHLRKNSVSKSYNESIGFRTLVMFKTHSSVSSNSEYKKHFLLPALMSSYIVNIKNNKVKRSWMYVIRLRNYVYDYLDFKWRLFIMLPYPLQSILFKLK